MAFRRYYGKTIFEDVKAKKFKKNRIEIKKFCEYMIKRINIEKDALILVTGPTGSGKSTLVGKMCFNNFENLNKPSFQEEKMYNDGNFFVDPKEFAKAMVTNKESVLWLDEAIEAIFNRSWSSEVNKLIVINKNKNRKLKNIHFLILPSPKQIDKALIPHLNFWIQCPARKNKNFVIARVFRAINVGLSSNGLDIYKMIEREEKWLKENKNKSIEDCPPTIHPEYIGYIKFSKFCKKDQKRYDSLIEKHQAYGNVDKIDSTLNKKELILKQEKIIVDIIKELEKGLINKKKDFWNKLKDKTGMTDAKLEKTLNRQLDIHNFPTFKKLNFPGDM